MRSWWKSVTTFPATRQPGTDVTASRARLMTAGQRPYRRATVSGADVMRHGVLTTVLHRCIGGDRRRPTTLPLSNNQPGIDTAVDAPLPVTSDGGLELVNAVCDEPQWSW